MPLTMRPTVVAPAVECAFAADAASDLHTTGLLWTACAEVSDLSSVPT